MAIQGRVIGVWRVALGCRVAPLGGGRERTLAQPFAAAVQQVARVGADQGRLDLAAVVEVVRAAA